MEEVVSVSALARVWELALVMERASEMAMVQAGVMVPVSAQVIGTVQQDSNHRPRKDRMRSTRLRCVASTGRFASTLPQQRDGTGV
jgi:hypothetical protein